MFYALVKEGQGTAKNNVCGTLFVIEDYGTTRLSSWCVCCRLYVVFVDAAFVFILSFDRLNTVRGRQTSRA